MIMRNLTVLIALLAIRLSASAEPEIKGTPTELAQYLSNVPKTVLVSGEAEVRLPAHRAVVTLTVTTENRSLQEALRANLELRGKLAERLKAQGLPSDRIQASKFSSTPKFGLFGDKAKSYRVDNVMRVVVQDEKEFQTVAASVDMSSEVQFSGVEFEYADRAALKDKAVGRACDNANERKKMYEEKLGLKLTPAGFSEGIVGPQDAALGNYANRMKSYGVSAGNGMMPAANMVATEESISSFGELVYTARVTVEFSVGK
jgi:uncharacterized protein YggE